MPELYAPVRVRSKGLPPPRISGGLPLVASLAPDTAQVDPVEDHHQVRRLDLDALRPGCCRRGREAEAAFFQTFIPQAVSVPVPPKDFDAIAATAPEDEEGDNRTPLSWRALSKPIKRWLRSPTPGRCSSWPAGAIVKEVHTRKEVHHVPIPFRPRPPPRRANLRLWAPNWPELPDDQRLQLLRVLGRMLTYRLSDGETVDEEGDHESH